MFLGSYLRFGLSIGVVKVAFLNDFLFLFYGVLIELNIIRDLEVDIVPSLSIDILGEGISLSDGYTGGEYASF